MIIRPYEEPDEAQVVSLWSACGLTRPWNDARKDIARKLDVQRELFLVGVAGDKVMASAMAGYDGHRGWLGYLAVAHEYRRHGHGAAIMARAEALLLQKGCPKINLQVRASNAEAVEFYRRIGYVQDEVVSFGKRLIPDGPAA